MKIEITLNKFPDEEPPEAVHLYALYVNAQNKLMLTMAVFTANHWRNMAGQRVKGVIAFGEMVGNLKVVERGNL